MIRTFGRLKLLAAAAVMAGGLALSAPAAQAAGRISIGVGFGVGGYYPAPVYQPAYCAPTYAAPAPVYYTPAPTYYAAPAPAVVYAPAPAPVYYSTPYYAPRAYYYAGPRFYSPLSFHVGFGFGGHRHR